MGLFEKLYFLFTKIKILKLYRGAEAVALHGVALGSFEQLLFVLDTELTV